MEIGSHSWSLQENSYSRGIFCLLLDVRMKKENCSEKEANLYLTFIRDFSNHPCYAIQFAIHFVQAIQ